MNYVPSETTLPNGRRFYHLAAAETAVLYREIIGNRCWLPPEIRLGPGAVVLDIGANIGIASLSFFLETRGDLLVHAFEPVPETHSCLSRNFRLHGITGGSHRLAVADRAGSATLTHYPRATTMSGLHADPAADLELTLSYLQNSGFARSDATSITQGMHEDARELPVTLTTVSEVIATHGLETVDYLKIDVERAELDVLRGVSPGDWQRIRQIGAEVHDENGRLGELRALLVSHGFAVQVRQDPLLAGTNVYDVFATQPHG